MSKQLMHLLLVHLIQCHPNLLPCNNTNQHNYRQQGEVQSHKFLKIELLRIERSLRLVIVHMIPHKLRLHE